MTAQEIAANSAEIVRKDDNLMGLYIEKYKDLFGFEPNCASCTFSHDFLKFQQKVRITHGASAPQKSKTMANTKFKLKLKHVNDILTYRVGNKPYRAYGYKLTPEFVEAFLTNGTKAEIKQRKELFEELTEAPKKAAKASSEKKKAVTPKTEEAPEKVAEKAVEEKVVDTLPRKKTGRKKNS